LALLLARYADAEFVAISAVLSGLPQVREVLGEDLDLGDLWRGGEEGCAGVIDQSMIGKIVISHCS
jgi:hypothetical protein